jgi:hypothetical protein
VHLLFLISIIKMSIIHSPPPLPVNSITSSLKKKNLTCLMLLLYILSDVCNVSSPKFAVPSPEQHFTCLIKPSVWSMEALYFSFFLQYYANYSCSLQIYESSNAVYTRYNNCRLRPCMGILYLMNWVQV